MTQGRRLTWIDALKGAAILCVIAQHAIPADTLDALWADLHIRQAVPVLFVLMGYNAVRAAARRPPAGLAEAYGRAYWTGRFWRILLPFAVVWVLAFALGAATGRLDVGPLVLVGAMPVPGPGTHFVTILFTFTLLWPAWWLAFRRRPGAVVLAAIALDLAFELAAGAIDSLHTGSYPYGYDAALPRYVAAIAVGMWLALDDRRAAGRRRLVLALAPLSVAFVVAVQNGYRPGFLVPGFGLATGLAAVPWSAALMLGAQRLWPAGGVRGTAWLEELGRASYHIFLVQIAWFGLVPGHAAWRYPADALVCCAVGWLLYRVLPTGRTRAARARIPRRSAGLRTSPPSVGG